MFEHNKTLVIAYALHMLSRDPFSQSSTGAWGEARKVQFPGRRITVGCAEKSQKCRKYFFHHHICFRKTLGSNMGQTYFFPLELSSLATTLSFPRHHLTALRSSILYYEKLHSLTVKVIIIWHKFFSLTW